jgi:acyl-coenzyme A thioesterase PaaI-like protein
MRPPKVDSLPPASALGELNVRHHPNILEGNENMHTPAGTQPALTPREAEQAIIKNLPPIDHHGEIVEEVGIDSLRIRLPFHSNYMGTEPWQDSSGKVFSGPMVMGFADTAMYVCVMSALGWDVIPVMANLNVTFLRPAKDADLIARAHIIRRGARLFYLECWLTSDGEEEPCAHVTSTYRVSHRKSSDA